MRYTRGQKIKINKAGFYQDVVGVVLGAVKNGWYRVLLKDPFLTGKSLELQFLEGDLKDFS